MNVCYSTSQFGWGPGAWGLEKLNEIFDRTRSPFSRCRYLAQGSKAAYRLLLGFSNFDPTSEGNPERKDIMSLSVRRARRALNNIYRKLPLTKLGSPTGYRSLRPPDAAPTPHPALESFRSRKRGLFVCRRI